MLANDLTSQIDAFFGKSFLHIFPLSMIVDGNSGGEVDYSFFFCLGPYVVTLGRSGDTRINGNRWGLAL